MLYFGKDLYRENSLRRNFFLLISTQKKKHHDFNFEAVEFKLSTLDTTTPNTAILVNVQKIPVGLIDVSRGLKFDFWIFSHQNDRFLI